MQNIEYCVICDQPTGRAGRCEDSMFITHPDESETGPLCEDCYDECQQALNDEKSLKNEGAHPDYPCRHDGRCQYAIDSGSEGLGHCPRGECVMPED